MSELTVRTSEGSYVVVIDEDAMGRAIELADVAVVDANVAQAIRPPPNIPSIEVVASEKLKTLAGCEHVILQLRALGVTRGSCLLAVGGGTVQDAATFTASIYMRGIPWVYAPTTLMAVLDSCIGGKSSINAGPAKNLIGNIYPPQSVHIDPSFAATLTPEMTVSGLAEAMKICYAGGAGAFDRYLELAPGSAEPAVTTELVEHVLGVKRWFVETDEFDRAERHLLNFGHTFAHALEAAVEFSIPHGVAVAVGVRAALRHPAAEAGSRTRLLDNYSARLLADIRPTVRDALGRLDASAFRQAFSGDKKHTSSAFVLVLPGPENADLPLRLVELPRSTAELDVALSCLRDAMEETV
jgi:3-dehydroquinate synthase